MSDVSYQDLSWEELQESESRDMRSFQERNDNEYETLGLLSVSQTEMEREFERELYKFR